MLQRNVHQRGSQNLGHPQDCNYGERRADQTGWIRVTGKYVQTLGPHQQGCADKAPSVTSPQDKAGPGQRTTDKDTDLQLLATSCAALFKTKDNVGT